MKFRTLLFLALCISFSAFAQKKTEYATFKKELKQKKYTPEVILEKALNYSSSHDIYVSELIDACRFFSSDRRKYRICVNAYPRIIDKRNFFQVYDLFRSFSFAMQLYHNTQANQNEVSQIDYPNAEYYRGPTTNSCNQPMPEYQFRNIYSQIGNRRNYGNRYIREIISNNCLSTRQIMKLTEKLQSNRDRFDLLKFAFQFSYDLENFYYTEQLIRDNYLKQQLNRFIDQEITQLNNHVGFDDCRPLSQSEYDYVLKSIKDERFTKERLKLAKQHIERNCFSIERIRAIVKEFSFDKDKLNILKLSYQSCPDKDQFYRLKETLSFSRYKREFDQFLLNR
ncbi:DUF4476 domain-containing protein [uncultured Tenacibaculum sp.]|uniref:DUF4476 domain-containing protein n=1 Tax=uncultured Tenacibaculum sp. TaxID=174713 RepID=UPI0026272DFF|nr:DUF4476 domain-containing protein [uncultured Tenacibaculum sp.]